MKRAKSWGFPNWQGYGLGEPEPVRVRMCDHAGCDSRGDCIAPKSPFSDEKWWFCEIHAAEYNRSWNFFEGMSQSEASTWADEARREAEYARANTWQWSGAASAETLEQKAFAVLGLDEEASLSEIKGRFRELAKANHPDRNPGDAAAEKRFKQIREAYELLKSRRP